MRPMQSLQHVLTHDEQSLLDLANVDPVKFKEVIRAMISSLPQLDNYLELPTNQGQSVLTYSNSFRPLNENELHILQVKCGIAWCESDKGTWLSYIDWDKLRVSYEELSGGFTVCLITYKPSETFSTFLWRGVSRRSYHDRPNRKKGEALAFIRAILESRPVEIYLAVRIVGNESVGFVLSLDAALQLADLIHLELRDKR